MQIFLKLERMRALRKTANMVGWYGWYGWNNWDKGAWTVETDQDRTCSEVTTRKMTEEEKEKYSKVKNVKIEKFKRNVKYKGGR